MKPGVIYWHGSDGPTPSVYATSHFPGGFAILAVASRAPEFGPSWWRVFGNKGDTLAVSGSLTTAVEVAQREAERCMAAQGHR